MKLIDYVLKHDLRVPKLAINAELVDMTVEEYILAFYCPSGFECLKRSPYHAPLKPHPNNIYTCMYDSGGSKGENRKFKHVCDKCKSILEYEMHDIELFLNETSVIKCPVCGEMNKAEYKE